MVQTPHWNVHCFVVVVVVVDRVDRVVVVVVVGASHSLALRALSNRFGKIKTNKRVNSP
jgi:hypothetical protein